MNYYIIRFNTRKQGTQYWRVYGMGLTRQDAVDRIQLLWDLEHPGRHMFGIKCSSASKDEAITELWQFVKLGTKLTHAERVAVSDLRREYDVNYDAFCMVTGWHYDPIRLLEALNDKNRAVCSAYSRYMAWKLRG